MYRALIKNEMFGDELSANTTLSVSMDPPHTPPRSTTRSSVPPPTTPKTPSRNLFTYMSPSQRGSLTPGSRPNSTGSAGSNRSGDLPTRDIYSLSPIRLDSQRLLLSPRKEPRTIPKVPYKVLDAPELKDDFYLNLVDWGAQNILAVGLGSSVYLWNAHNGVVKKLVDLGDQDHITGIGWIPRGTHLAVGTNKGLVRIWDTESGKAVRTMTGHTQRVGTPPCRPCQLNGRLFGVERTRTHLRFPRSHHPPSRRACRRTLLPQALLPQTRSVRSTLERRGKSARLWGKR
jgi:cell division cycle 20-like protein 1, cofactor of APC complex